ncbi:MAG: hypothetical protein RID53_11960 [Coleofasciculus sp. B1-GNL1-01]|uniref:hypothetical protein n=1 Tax=Coleofasciculus sp. B1-GNL1-01 TaxID=3068484 RepID=UPI0033045834
MNVCLEFFARYTLIILSVTMLVICQTEGQNQAADPSLPENGEETMKEQNTKIDTVQLQITAEPLEFSISEIQNFKISLTATNQSDEVTNPELHLVKLFINGEQSMAWNLAISNGLREEKWFALPAGDRVSMSWSMGQSLFPTPGEYTLVPSYKDKELEPIQVHVLP